MRPPNDPFPASGVTARRTIQISRRRVLTVANTADILVIGGGIVGLTVALEARRRWPESSVVLVEKEPGCGMHASSRNSGVLHAGFYYAADSLKARFTVEGNQLLTTYCEERGLALNRCGKLVVARNPDEVLALEALRRRGIRNGCTVELLDEREARELEPRVRTFRSALFSPATSSVDPGEVMESIVNDAVAAGVVVKTKAPYRSVNGSTVVVGNEAWQVGHVINASGLYADRVAHDFGFGVRYSVVPFKGLYLLANPGTEPLRRHVYPVPDMDNQFHLGLHLTVAVDGRSKIGPTAIPAMWREQYSGFENFRAREAAEVVRRQAALWWRDDFSFRHLAVGEMQKYSKRRLVRMASSLVADLDQRNFQKWGTPGIRAQLYDVQAQALVPDFTIEGDSRSTHILNAVSPAFTCCFPFAAHVIDRVDVASSN
jgi:L-2-hydroxyglutarate oxidase LhgO